MCLQQIARRFWNDRTNTPAPFFTTSPGWHLSLFSATQRTVRHFTAVSLRPFRQSLAEVAWNWWLEFWRIYAGFDVLLSRFSKRIIGDYPSRICGRGVLRILLPPCMGLGLAELRALSFCMFLLCTMYDACFCWGKECLLCAKRLCQYQGISGCCSGGTLFSSCCCSAIDVDVSSLIPR